MSELPVVSYTPGFVTLTISEFWAVLLNMTGTVAMPTSLCIFPIVRTVGVSFLECVDFHHAFRRFFFSSLVPVGFEVRSMIRLLILSVVFNGTYP